ncbi:MAG: NADH-quinone oxidoreductase subunit J [Anaerolineales bacterium]|nr:NADH-quinone oxidoreductase subunit J [Anaerolineales bacterium]
MTSTQIIFLITAAATLAAGIYVVSARNLVHAALALVATFFGVAILFALLQAGFLAAVQVVLYIGAIAILIIFAIMLTRRVMEDSGPQTNRLWGLAAALALAAFGALVASFRLVPLLQQVNATLPVADATATLKSLGYAFVDPNQYLLSFELASVLLLVALIGSIVIAADRK